MKTTKLLLIIIILTSNLAFSQDKKDIEKESLIQTDVENAKKDAANKDEQRKIKEEEIQKNKDQKNLAAKSATQDNDQDKIAMAAYITPGHMHKILQSLEGDWNQTIQYWSNPLESPDTSSAKCTISMILGGRYQKSISKGKMGGMAFEGQGIIGYDNILKKFQSTWIDNMGTGTLTTIGTFNEKLNKFEFVGRSIDPLTSKEVEVLQTIQIQDKNKMVLEMFTIKDGTKNKSLEITYNRIIKKNDKH